MPPHLKHLWLYSMLHPVQRRAVADEPLVMPPHLMQAFDRDIAQPPQICTAEPPDAMPPQFKQLDRCDIAQPLQSAARAAMMLSLV